MGEILQKRYASCPPQNHKDPDGVAAMLLSEGKK
jgi:hypothetical protein